MEKSHTLHAGTRALPAHHTQTHLHYHPTTHTQPHPYPTQPTKARDPTFMTCGSTCAVRMARICQTCDGARIGSAGSRAGSWGRQALRTAYGTVSDRRCRRPTTVAAVAASRSTRSTSGGQGDHGRGGGAPASFQRRGCPG